jgi:hypothetical protein
MVEAVRDDSRLSPKHDELNELQEVLADLVIAAYRGVKD